MKLFLAGDVMIGRGIDRILAHPGDPALHEPRVRSAETYVALAEASAGPIPRGVGEGYVWGDLLAVLRRQRPAATIVNLETAITARGRPAPRGINYRVHPANAGVLRAAGIDCCVLANNHVLDWGEEGLRDTLATLRMAGILAVGAGEDAAAARAPAGLPRTGAKDLAVLAYATPTSGVPPEWSAGAARPGVNLLPALDAGAIERVRADAALARADGRRIVLASIHWGANWVRAVPEEHRRFARALVDEAGVDVVFAHSSHHPLGVEVHRGRAIIHGAGDLLNDYEGIGGHEELRPELVLGWFLDLERESGALEALEMVPLRIRRFRLERATPRDAAWLADRMDRQCRRLGAGVETTPAGTLALAAPAGKRTARTPRAHRPSPRHRPH